MIASDREEPEESASEYWDEELFRHLQAQTMAILSQGDRLMPHYREDIASEHAFERAADTMPLIAVWGERFTHEGCAFSISVNARLVAQALMRHVHPNDPWFNDLRAAIIKDLSLVTRRTLISTIERTGLSPRVICDSI
ncbi:hypothetical protein [Sphingopyxis alaskensis]|jgi:hypothetical protein|uniref:hypothetical protein n=1 Tax=Sphingopyxis alaskensis TaxID=117207 RepID=UPI0019CF096A|nr:hypothetical protein [Sphingopyxis alaskensis]MBD3744919.1 hypothetical protein [Sphingopyxis terrae]MCM3420225.1 hypothetical protein [Sphingopyxis alaskensis]